MKKLFLALLVCIFLLNCAGQKILQKYTPENPAKVGFVFELTDPSQMIVADSLGSHLVSRLLIFAKERGDFELVKGGEKSDLILRIKVTDFQLVSSNKQYNLGYKRRKIENKYEAIKDSVEMGLRGNRNKEQVINNLGRNLALNMLTIPFGYMVAVYDPNTQAGYMSEKDRKRIDSTYTEARLGYMVTIESDSGIVEWKRHNSEELKLVRFIPERQQLSVLARNVIMTLEDKIPLLRLP